MTLESFTVALLYVGFWCWVIARTSRYDRLVFTEKLRRKCGLGQGMACGVEGGGRVLSYNGGASGHPSQT